MATIKQKKAIQKLSENVRNEPLGKILKEAGYSDSVSKSPTKVTRSKGWKQLINEYFPDEELLKAHKKLLNKKEIVVHQGEFKKTGQPHSDVKYALDLLYKLKGLYRDTELSYVEKNGRTHFEEMSNEELDQWEIMLKKEHRLLCERLEKYGKRRGDKSG